MTSSFSSGSVRLLRKPYVNMTPVLGSGFHVALLLFPSVVRECQTSKLHNELTVSQPRVSGGGSGADKVPEASMLDDVALLGTSMPVVEEGTDVLIAGMALVRDTMPSKRNAARGALRLVSLFENIMEECLYRCW